MRYWVYNALCSVLIDKVYSNIYLKNNLNQVDSKDRSLATHIFYGTLQNYTYCEYIWKQFAKKKVNKKIGILLSMSVYQLKFLDKVPSYAILNESVNIAKKVNPNTSGFVNAILHNVIKNEITLPSDEIERVSIETSLPEWLLWMWKAQYGWQQAKENAYYSNQIMPIVIRRNPLKISDSKLLEYSEFKPFTSGLYLYSGNDISKNSLYKNGDISIQDEGSYLIAKELDACRSMKVLDTCAAPGTKSMAIAEMMGDTGSIDSLDIYSHRVSLIENDCKRLGLSCIHPRLMDATDLDDLGMYDRILCDVPCSGYGVLARKPDIKYSMKSNDMDSLIVLQYELLCEASTHLKKDGILVYSTCTLNKKENEKQIEKFLKSHTDFELLLSKTLFPSKNKEGFYIGKLKRV